jgi:hypothetical protein
MRLGILCAFVLAFSFTPTTASSQQLNGSDTRSFSAKDRQADLLQLRDFVYPKGYSDQTIVALENGDVPADMPVEEYARLHCGESARMVLYPCMLRYADKGKPAYYVISQGANMRFTNLKDAAAYFRERVTNTTSNFAMEVDVMNMFVEEFCAQIAAGARARDVIAARGGDRPRINHPIAPANPAAKYQFSTLFSWEKCVDCVGIIAINQPAENPPPSCGALRKQSTPHIAYFVVDRTSSKGHRSLDDSIAAFTSRAMP